MQHRYIVTTLGLFALGWLGLAGEAAAAPVGYWLKEDGAAKLQISQCGRNQLCGNIVWLRDPLDSRGNPLHDARNENPSLRGRPIIGLPIFQGLVPDGRNTWKGQIYNPEDGGTYKATLTQVSRSQVVLKGCLAMFLCGQKTWTRTTFNPEPEEPEEIEVKETEEPAKPEPVMAKADEPKEEKAAPRTMEASLGGMPSGFTTASTGRTAELKPALPPAHRDATAGYGFVLTTSSPDSPPELIESNAARMYLVSPNPAQAVTVQSASARTTASTTQRSYEPRTASDPSTTQSTSQPGYASAQQPGYATGPQGQTETADTGMDPNASVPMPNQRPAEIEAYAEAEALAQQDHLSWRDRRRLRKLKRELPWLTPGQEASIQAPTSVQR